VPTVRLIHFAARLLFFDELDSNMDYAVAQALREEIKALHELGERAEAAITDSKELLTQMRDTLTQVDATCVRVADEMP
jgi:hypothetical protein